MLAIVHIGAPKAGSTALQETLRANRGRLWSQGIFAFAPQWGPFDRALSARFANQNEPVIPNLRDKFATPAAMHRWSMRNWQDLERRVHKNRPEVTILSSEHFLDLAEPEALYGALRTIFDEIAVICYLRDPVALYPSKINQQIRDGLRLSQLETPDAFAYRPASRIEAHVRLADAGRIAVRNFDRANLTGGDIVRDFCQRCEAIIGRPVGMPRVPEQSNESLCGAASAWLLGVNETFVPAYASLETIAARRGVIMRLRADPVLAEYPRLKLDDARMAQCIRRNAAPVIAHHNSAYFTDQKQWPEAAATVDHGGGPEDARARMRDWLWSYADPQALRRVIEVATAER
ncbi:hypothetical protein [Profundibacterium mesophilum]|uniref:Sulfotransferase familydomain containing protein n=1 Tax=Profundibacterium mesophilum KAUST100406-0324 TaxID=1037889 RepID=A0A921TBP6_9RHOB|nr:hypothetical protein [Profundibacterium mesophilum]KAF0674593.1 Sulfotransferase familydomain containing protein [Profundibacterium mesophilum KAUST100406-0324]